MDSIVEAIAHFAEQKPDAVAVIAEKQQITYAELWKEVRGFASYIRSRELEKGLRIIVEAKHSIWYIVAWLGIQLAGCVFAPVEKKVGTERLRDTAEQLSASMIISNAELESAQYIMVSPSAVRDLATSNFYEDVSFDFPRPEDLCEIMFTTGTTGKSKGVMLTYSAIVAIAESRRSGDAGYNVSENNIHLIAVPINHTGGIRNISLSLFTGTTAVLLDGFLNFKLFFQYIRDYHVTSITMPPSAVRMALVLAAEEMAKYTDQLDFIQTGDTSYPKADQERFCELLPRTRLYFTYGSTEAGGVSVLEYSKYKKEGGCSGRPSKRWRVFTVDDDKKEFASSKSAPGRIAVSGKGMMSGYYNEPELTKEYLSDGVLYTNDIGYFDEDGYLYVIGRRGDVINLGGLKIAPAEVENVALRFSGIAECACFVVQDARDITVLKLNIVEQQGSNIEIGELREYMRGNLEAHQVPKLIEKVSEIPKTYNGKIDRKALK